MKAYTAQTKTNKIVNGETVAYTFSSFICIFILIAVKQLLKTFFSVSVTASCCIGFAAASIISYLLEKRFVFAKSVSASNLKQIIFLVIRTGVNLGFYKLAQFCFYDLLDMPESFAWFIAILTSFLFNYVYDRTLLFDCNYEAQSVKKSRIYKLFYANRYVFLAGCLALICISALYLVYSVFPFGDYTVMRMDLYHQYGPLFAELYDRIVNHQSLLYSWTTGGGSSFLGNYLNYLSSPLTVLIFLFDKEDISFAITLLVAVKAVLSAASFAYYLKQSQNGNNLFSCVFAVFYAFSGYFLAYYWNVMWLDGMIMLPLIALGIEYIFKNGSIKLYTASLVILFFANYYMGFMCCIFSVIYFLVYYIISFKNDGKLVPNAVYKKRFSTKALMNNTFINRGLRFALGSILAGALCAITLLPVFMILKNSSATSGTFPDTFISYFDLLDFITSHFVALETTIRSSGDNVLPNIYSGTLTIILLALFVINDKISIREKAAYIATLLFFLFSFDNNCANYIWHAFHFPNDLPYRFSFMYSFVLLIMGYKTISKFGSIKSRDIGFVGMGLVLTVIICQKFMTNKMSNYTIYATIASILMWCLFLMILKRKSLGKKLLSYILCVFVLGETILNTIYAIPITQPNEDYKENYDSYTQAIDYINQSDSGFYKTELCYLNTRMDPAYYGYNGMSTFSSMAYEAYSGLQKSLGMYGNRINSYTYNEQTPVYNMMFNIKYLIQTDVSLEPSDGYYTKLYETDDGESRVYANNYSLPVAYCVNSAIEDWVTDEGNPFELQSDFLKLGCGYSDVFSEVEYKSTDFSGASGDEVTENGTYWINKDDASSTYATETITLSPTIDGDLFLCVDSGDIDSLTVNSDKVSNIVQSIDESYILYLGYHDKGDEVNVELDAGTMEDESGSFDIYTYTCNEKIFKAAYNKLSQNALNVTSYSDTSIKGTVTASESCYLYSSIPYDDGWTVYVDGEKQETFEIGSALLAIELTPGEHEIEYKFSPSGFGYGVIITAITALGICGYNIIDKSSLKINKSKRRKKEKIVD